MEFLWYILIGLAAGWLAGQIWKGGDFGLVGNLVVGVLGAVLGGWIFSALGVGPKGDLLGPLIVATVGALVLLFLLSLLKKSK